MKNKGNTKKISNESGGTLGKRKSSDLGSVSSLNFSEEQRKDCAEKFTIFPQPTVDYLNSWISQHTENPFPDASEKAKIMRDTGLSKRQVGDVSRDFSLLFLVHLNVHKLTFVATLYSGWPGQERS